VTIPRNYGQEPPRNRAQRRSSQPGKGMLLLLLLLLLLLYQQDPDPVGGAEFVISKSTISPPLYGYGGQLRGSSHDIKHPVPVVCPGGQRKGVTPAAIQEIVKATSVYGASSGGHTAESSAAIGRDRRSRNQVRSPTYLDNSRHDVKATSSIYGAHRFIRPLG